MATNQSRRETLKLYRIQIRGTAFYSTVSGYLNKKADYLQYNTVADNNTYIELAIPNPATGDNAWTARDFGWVGPSPDKFLIDRGFSGESSFIIADIFEQYDRKKHDLDALSSSVWIVVPGKGMPIQNAVNKDRIRQYTTTPISPTHETLEFDVNPTNINIVKKKLFQKIRTRGGWAFQHWGPDIGEIQLTGITRNITPAPVGFKGIPIPDVTNSGALAAFRTLEAWYDADQGEEAQRTGSLLALEYRGKIYVGHLRDFSYSEEGTRPFLLSYKLTFMVHYDSGDLSGATTSAQSRAIRNANDITYIKSLKTPEADTSE